MPIPPHENGPDRPPAKRSRRRGLICLVAATLGATALGVGLTHDPEPRSATISTAAAPQKAPPKPVISRQTKAENEVVRLTNIERRRAGCRPLRHDARLRKAARGHSVNMRNRKFFSHTSPDGRSPWDRIRAAGYPAGAAENIAKGYPGPRAVVRGWMASRGHRANILNCSLKAIGAGAAFGPGGPWWTQDFGRR